LSKQLSLLGEDGPKRRRPGTHQLKSPGSKDIRVSREMEIGRAGEYLVLSDLLISGWVAYPTGQGVPYDIAVDIGRRIVRVQVKSTMMPKSAGSMNRKTPLYIFSTKRAGKEGKRKYAIEEFDILALVALDRRLIAYYSVWENSRELIAIRVPGIFYQDCGVRSRHFEDARFDLALKTMLELEDEQASAEES
jgi:hypothetical protein